MVLETKTCKEVVRVPAEGSCGGVYQDAERKCIYALGSEGFVSVRRGELTSRCPLARPFSAEVNLISMCGQSPLSQRVAY